MRARAKRRLRKARDVIRQILTIGGLLVKNEDVSRGLRVGGNVVDALSDLDANEKRLRDEYGVGPDR